MNQLQKAAAARAAPPVPPRRLPITITLVIRNMDHYNTAEFKQLREFCATQNIMWDTREYDSYRYRHDRDEISALPALHAHINGYHERTFYPNTRPIQHIQEVITVYHASVERARERQKRWRSFFTNLRAILKQLLIRAPTRMEREEAKRHATAVATAMERRNSFQNRMRRPSAAEWV